MSFIVEGEAGKVEMPAFLLQPWKGLTTSGVRVLARQSESRSFSFSKPLHDSADRHPTVIRLFGDFTPVPDHAKEGGYLDSFFIPFQCNCKGDQTRSNSMFRTHCRMEPVLPCSCLDMEARRIKVSALLCVVWHWLKISASKHRPGYSPRSRRRAKKRTRYETFSSLKALHDSAGGYGPTP